MKTASVLFCAVLALSSTLFLNSCKKNDGNGASSNTLRSMVQDWSTGVLKNSSEETKSSVSGIISTLNYEDGAIINQSGSQTAIFISKGSSAGRRQYLALTKNGDNFQARGIYEAKDLEQIENFLETKKLPAGEQITVYSLFNKAIVQWETTTSGKSLLRMAQTKKVVNNLLSKNKVQTASTRRSMNALPPPPDGCTDWYWVSFDPDSGDIIDISYMYTTCGNGGGESNGSSSQEQVVCIQSAIEDTHNISESADLLSVTDDETTTLTRKRSYHWKICQGNGWYIKSHEQGTHQYSYADNGWKWLTLTHSSVSVEGTWIGGTISCSVNTATPSVYDLYAGMQLNYTVHYQFICAGTPFNRNDGHTSGIIIGINQAVE